MAQIHNLEKANIRLSVTDIQFYISILKNNTNPKHDNLIANYFKTYHQMCERIEPNLVPRHDAKTEPRSS
jgi:hypothetical protein